MSGVVRRKVLKDEKSNVEKRRKPSNYGSRRLRFYFLTGLALIFCLVVYLYLFLWSSSHSTNILDRFQLSLGLRDYIYSIVVDAGSTGSRVLAYGFAYTRGSKLLKLNEEHFLEVEPGMSAYAKNPRECVKSFDSLIGRAKKLIPKQEWPKTSLMMKATAGLRLLPEKQAQGLLNEASTYFQGSGFKVGRDSVSIMDGSEEGLMSWFTVNFLLDRLDGNDRKTVVALDLGGGSTQVSFAADENNVMSPSLSKYISKISVAGGDLEVYSRSYLGLGLMEGRRQIFEENLLRPSDIVRSPCVKSTVDMIWSYGGLQYNIRGPNQTNSGEDSAVNYANCLNVAKKVVAKYEKAPNLVGKEIYAFSYYYDRAVQAGLLKRGETLEVTVGTIEQTAMLQCQDSSTNQPLLCLDLVYITTLLKDMYGLTDSTKIMLVKWLNGHEVSWALGAAFMSLQNQLE